MNVLKKLKKEELPNCVGKGICFWSKGGSKDKHPEYYEWVKKISKDKTKILVSSLSADKRCWQGGRWMNIKGFNFKSCDWYVFNLEDLDKIVLAYSI